MEDRPVIVHPVGPPDIGPHSLRHLQHDAVSSFSACRFSWREHVLEIYPSLCGPQGLVDLPQHTFPKMMKCGETVVLKSTTDAVLPTSNLHFTSII